MKNLTIAGLFITASWVTAFAALIYVRWADAATLSLNAWGDLMAGLTAPLALLWIVIGYFQQGEELRLNTEALKAQQEQLRRQVEETAVLAANSSRQAVAAEKLAFVTLEETEHKQLKAKAEFQPIFRANSGTNTGASVRTFIKNTGATVKNLSVKAQEPVLISISSPEILERGQDSKLRIENVVQYPYWFEIAYQDLLGQNHTKKFQMIGPHRFREI